MMYLYWLLAPFLKKNIAGNEKVLKMLKMAYDKLQILAGTSLPFFISFNTVFSAVPFHRTSYEAQKKRNNNF